METLKKRGLQQITFNHSADIDFKYFMNLLQNHTFLVTDTTLASDNLPHLRKNLLERT